MLKLKNITKDYALKDQEPVHALKGVSVTFRKNEFIAILGPSGCGKTTLLNIIGGLDRYSSGDLIIKGKSTKDYTDYDWDTYRNHSIGFVFQSYNLISHQSLLKNVELALTISGVKKQERKARALEALEKVGLKGLERKKPNQLSGGQMQRVAIARALVNNPEILLADEPTGALDSETSIQIMDLLKEVAKDRLVIMVTHNPDLANKYATRIVNMFDGVVTGDSNPYENDDLSEYKQNESKKEKQSAMTFKTATVLSFANLFSKLKRTVLIVVAGSIGIIGVSAVLSVSHGVTNYIYGMQDDMLSSYPLSIAEEAVDYTSLMTSMGNWHDDKNLYEFDKNTQVGLDSMINYLMTAYSDLTSVKTNYIGHELISYLEDMPKEYINTILYDYSLDVTNNIFTTWKKDYTPEKDEDVISLNGLTQRYISELKTVDGFSSYASYVDLFTDFMRLLPDNKDYILNQYDLIGNSKYADEENQIMLVLDPETKLTDLLLAQMGIYDHDEFINIAQKALAQNSDTETRTDEELNNDYPYRYKFDYDDLIGREFYYFPHDAIYSYGPVTTESYEEYTIIYLVGSDLLYLQYDADYDALVGIQVDFSSGADYKTVAFLRYSEKQAESSVKLINGTWANVMGGNIASLMISNAEDATTQNIVALDSTSTIISGSSSFSIGVKNVEPVSGYQYKAVVDQQDMLDHPENYGGMKLIISGILRKKDTVNFGSLSRGLYYNQKLARRYMNDSISSEIICDPTNGFKAYVGSEQESHSCFPAFVTFDYLDYTDADHPVEKHDGYASSLNGDLGSSFSSLFSSLTGIDYLEQDMVYLRSLSGLKIIENADGAYSFDDLPEKISIYPTDFKNKDNVTDYLDKWNDKKEIIEVTVDGVKKTLTHDDRDELTYTDTVELIITVINTLVTTVTVALISFTSLSLVVSCFMIAVITYISTMERVKEIGVIRSLGGRKKDVSRLFIAENLITGLSSGIFGIVVTYIFQTMLNICIAPLGVSNIAALPLYSALIMIGVSILLNVISGLIPSMKASHQDPVIALRSE